MSISDENNKQITEKVQKTLDAEKQAKFEEETALLKDLQDIFKRLDEAKRRENLEEVKSLKGDLTKILTILGDSTKESLEKDLTEVEKTIKDNGATTLNIANKNNVEAKLGVIDRKEEIIAKSLGVKKEENTASKVLVGVVGGALAGVIGFAGFARGCSNEDTLSATSTDTEITETSTEPTTIGTTTTTTTTSGSTLETVDDNDYSAATTTTNTDPNSNENGNGKGNGNTNGGNKKGGETKKLRETKSPTATSWISKPKNNTPKPTKNTKSTVQTDVNGTQAHHTEPQVKPSGNDKLPTEPTKVTVNKKATPTPKPTSKPTAKPTSKPQQTVDPDVDGNVVEKCAAVVDKPKVLKLTFGNDYNIFYSIEDQEEL